MAQIEVGEAGPDAVRTVGRAHRRDQIATMTTPRPTSVEQRRGARPMAAGRSRVRRAARHLAATAGVAHHAGGAVRVDVALAGAGGRGSRRRQAEDHGHRCRRDAHEGPHVRREAVAAAQEAGAAPHRTRHRPRGPVSRPARDLGQRGLDAGPDCVGVEIGPARSGDRPRRPRRSAPSSARPRPRARRWRDRPGWRQRRGAWRPGPRSRSARRAAPDASWPSPSQSGSVRHSATYSAASGRGPRPSARRRRARARP